MKKITHPIALTTVLFLVALPMRALAQQTSVKLFDATPVSHTGPVTSAAAAVPFATTSLILDFAPGDTAVISSTPDGTGPIVIDNFLTINGQSVCVPSPDACFGPVINPALPTGAPIEAILTAIPPIDVAARIPLGTTSVLFELRDFGSIAGNTNVFLITSATVKLPLGPSLDTIRRALQRLENQIAVLAQDARVTRARVQVIDQNVAVTKGQVAVIDQNVAVTKGQVAVIDQNVAVTKGQVAVIDQNVAVTKGQVQVIDQNVAVTKGQVQVIDQNVRRVLRAVQ